MDAEEKPVEPSIMKEQSLSSRNENSVSPPSSLDTSTVVNSRGSSNQSGGVDHTGYSSNVYSPQAQAFYYRGFDNATGEWDENSRLVSADGLKGIYNDSHSHMFHTAFGYSPQMPYSPYSPVTPPLPSAGGDAQVYSSQQYSFSGPPYYQQLVSPSMPYIASPTQVSHPELATLITPDHQGDGTLFGPRPDYPSPLGSFGRGNFHGNSGTLGFHDLQQGYDGFRSGGLWSDWSKAADRQRPFSPLSSPQQMGALGSFGNFGMATQQQRSLHGFGSGSNSYNRGYMHGDYNQGSSFGSASISNLGMNSRGWLALDSNKQRGRGSSSLCSCNGTLDILSEQNRGPRASKPKNQSSAEHGTEENGKIRSTIATHDQLYNQTDFVTEYEDAKFFIIKSYSEDNVHKSIKYGVWASTPNGNKKLDAAYHDAKEKPSNCPVFLLFSVNASAHFCGVAEMVGPVDFDRNVDYWQQDKWSGQFPVKWHIIKDIPNSQFRHIVLENNDNKPVTNSRDTQEVKLEQGIEMLKIFKNYETGLSILDDFEFYEDRQKTMQEWKAKQGSIVVDGVVGGNGHRPASLASDLIKQMSKSFAQVIRLEEPGKEGQATDRGTSVSADTAITVSSAQSN